jgi:regulator of replication initiation timing
VSESDVQHLLDESMREVEHLRAENERLRTLLHVPVLRAMHSRRLTTYKTLGFSQEQSPPVASSQLAVPILGS